MTIKAEIAQVKIGPLSIEGLMSENGEFGVAVPQAADLNLVRRNQASRDLKALLDGIEIVKWLTPLNPKPVNVIPLQAMEPLLFKLASNGNEAAVNFWNQIHPDTPFAVRPQPSGDAGIESRVEDFVMELYQDFNPSRQVVTDFGKADVVHDFGVVEIKEYRSIRSAHTAIGQAIAYGSILGKQPEVILFNVPEDASEKILRMFTAVGILVLLFSRDDTKKAIKRQKWHPTQSNAAEIQFQASKPPSGTL